MRSKWWRLALLLTVPLPLAGEARDPFQPAEDRCQVAALTQWRYGGAIGSPQLWIGAGAGIAMIAAATRLRRWRDDN